LFQHHGKGWFRLENHEEALVETQPIVEEKNKKRLRGVKGGGVEKEIKKSHYISRRKEKLVLSNSHIDSWLKNEGGGAMGEGRCKGGKKKKEWHGRVCWGLFFSGG